MKHFDRTNLKILRAQIDAALASVAKNHGIKINAGNATFSGATATFKLEFAAADSDGGFGGDIGPKRPVTITGELGRFGSALVKPPVFIPGQDNQRRDSRGCSGMDCPERRPSQSGNARVVVGEASGAVGADSAPRPCNIESGQTTCVWRA